MKPNEYHGKNHKYHPIIQLSFKNSQYNLIIQYISQECDNPNIIQLYPIIIENSQ